jgi:hypothetical protein
MNKNDKGQFQAAPDVDARLFAKNITFMLTEGNVGNILEIKNEQDRILGNVAFSD